MYLSYPQAPIGFLWRYKWVTFSWRRYGAEVQPPLAWCGQPRTSRTIIIPTTEERKENRIVLSTAAMSTLPRTLRNLRKVGVKV